MGDPNGYYFTLDEPISEGLLLRVLDFHQRYLQSVMTQREIDEEAKTITAETRTALPKWVFDFDPKSGKLMDELKIVTDIGYTLVTNWQYCLPFGFFLTTQSGIEVQMHFYVEICIIGKNEACVRHNIFHSYLIGEGCYDQEKYKGDDFRDECGAKARPVVAELLRQFERNFTVIAKKATDHGGANCEWDM